MKEETSVLRQVLEELSLRSLANLLPSVIWVDGFPCELRITRRGTIYHVEYVDYDIDGESVEIEAEGKTLPSAIIEMFLKLLDMPEKHMTTYEDEKADKDGHKQDFDVEYLLKGLGETKRLNMERPTEVHLCVLRHDDGTFKMICGCFYSKEAAERYANGSPRITIQKQSVI